MTAPTTQWAWRLGNNIVQVFPGSRQEDVIIAAGGEYLTEEVPIEAQPGWRWDGIAREWRAPPPPPAPPPLRVLSTVAYRQRFTFAERAAIYTAARTDPIVGELTRSLDDPRLLTIHLDHPETVAGIDYLIAQGLVSAARKDALLRNVE